MTPDRKDKYKWVGPTTDMKLIFFKKKGSSIDIKSLNDAKKIKKIGVAKGVGNYDILKARGFKNLDIIGSGEDVKNIKKLIIYIKNYMNNCLKIVKLLLDMKNI